MIVRIQPQAFDIGAEVAALTRGRSDIGAIVTFTGVCRDEGGSLAALEIEHYPGMAEEEIARVVEKAQERWPLQGVAVVHRHGRIAAGEEIVLVVTVSAHRAIDLAVIGKRQQRFLRHSVHRVRRDQRAHVDHVRCLRILVPVLANSSRCGRAP